MGLVLFGVALVASPIALTGREELSLGQIAGFLVAPVGLVVVMIAAASFDPERTTVHGAFGSDDARANASPSAAGPVGHPLLANPRAPAHCRYCRTVISYDLARCPRCARDRPCRTCGRSLSMRDEQATCPACSRPEFFCNCSHLEGAAGFAGSARARRIG